jgi:putative FmdB family regulatory protein
LSKEEEFMPLYDFVCEDCHKEFELALTLKEHESRKVSCPKCRSKNVVQEPAKFYAVTSRKS